MTDVITGEDVPCSDRNFSKINNLRPADQEEDSSHQPAAEMREQSLRNVLSEHVSISDFAEKPALTGLALEGSRLRLPEASRTPPGAASSAPPSFSPEDGFSAEPISQKRLLSSRVNQGSEYRFAKTTREPQVPIGIDSRAPKPKYAFQSASA